MSDIFGNMSAALQEGDADLLKEMVEKALAEGTPANDILERGLLAGMDVIAVKFKNNEVYVPEVLIAARAMNAATAILKSHLAEDGVKAVGKAVIATVKGDLHDIGKNLVRMMFEGKGIEVIDIGIDVSAEQFVEAYHAEKPEIIAMSALLTTTMAEMKETVQAFIDAGVRDKVTIMIGGAPVTDEFCKTIGADIYMPDAGSASEAAKNAILAKR